MSALPKAGSFSGRVPPGISGMVECASAGIRRSRCLAGDRRSCAGEAWCQPHGATFHRRFRRRPTLRDAAEVRTGRRRISRRSFRRSAAEGCRYRQCSEMLAARQQAGTGRNRDVPELLRGCAGRTSECSKSCSLLARLRTSLQRERSVCRPQAPSSDTAQKSLRPMAECCCRAITALVTTRTPGGSTARCSKSVFERAVSLSR